MFAIGIDIGGTKTRIGLVKETGALISIKEIPTDLSLPPEAFLKIIAHECHPFLDQASSIGIGIAGQTKNGHLYFAPNLNWKDLAVGESFCKLTSRPVVVENDVRVALYGESILGAGVGCNDLLMISLGTGLGGAVLANGQLVRGDQGSAGEIGHLCIEIDGRACTCGGRGCLEAYVGGWAIEKEAGRLSPEQVFMHAKNGDPRCLKIVEDVEKALGAGITTLVNIFNPRRLICTGGIFQSHPEMIERVRIAVNQRALPIATMHLEWRRGELEYPGVIGSALTALQPDFYCNE